MRKILLPLAMTGSLVFGLGGCVATWNDYGTGSTQSQFSMDDIMFAQMMIPHHEQAVELATIAESNTTNPAILDLAARIKNAQQPEIDQMQAWLDDDNAGMDMSHNMAMPGIVSDKDMATIRGAKDAEFDSLFLTHMIAHHKGAIEMVNDLIADSANPEVTALGQAIVKAQTAEIDEMSALLKG